MKTITCPYCGEEIASIAKKCRFCGEWLTDVPNRTKFKPHKEPLPVEVVEKSSVTELNNAPIAKPAFAVRNAPAQPNISSPTQPQQTIQSVGGQPIIVNVVNQHSVEQRVDQNTNVVIANGANSEEAPGWIFAEMWLIAGGIGIATKSWWWFFGVAIGGSMLLMIPFIGALMCVVIGLGWGLVIGAIVAAIFGTTAAWIIGIFVALGTIYGHLEARKANMEEG